MKQKITQPIRCLIVIIFVLFASCSGKAKFDQPLLGYKTVNILKKGGYEFKDLNKNGKLDIYEDWRLSAEERTSDLLSQMTLEEKIGFMIISQINMGSKPADNSSDISDPRSGGGVVTSDLNEEDVISSTNMFTGLASDSPSINVSGTTKGIKERHLRHFILRANAPAKTIAEWSNNVQAVAEDSRLGIPVIFASNPRNHITTDNSIGVNVGNTFFTQWPSTLGLGAMDDLNLVRKFAESAASEWAACGIRKGYMYQLDLATEPRWSRIEGTFGEDADRVAAIAKEIVYGFQGETLGPKSVVLTMKHFPGAGAELKGWDAHYDYGKNLVYPGNMMEYHLKPFIAAIEAGTSGIMPYYALPKGTKYEEVGFTYNYGIITELLRNELGFKGLINSDTGPINNMPWGVEVLSILERYQKALNAGTDLFSGGVDTENLLKTVTSGFVNESRIDESVTRLLIEKFKIGLFENPYVDPEIAEKTANNQEYRNLAEEAFRKSIVLLRNNSSLLPLKAGTKVYLETLSAPGRNGNGRNVVIPEENTWDIEFTNDRSKADVVILWITPGGGSMFSRGSAGAMEVNNKLSANSVDVNYVNRIAASKPTIVLINFSKPWVLQEIDTKNANTWLATFGTTLPAVIDVVTGKHNPSGKLPFAIPASQKAVEDNKEDVPGNLEPEGYALFKCGHGLSY